jgi:metacaspase-1
VIHQALCIGINAYGHGSDLSGCVNDARDWEDEFIRRGAEPVVTMTDAGATRENMLNAMRGLVGALKYGETGVITYSGHGTYVPDTGGDEADRRDEALCPVDLWDNGVITDDTLYEIFSAKAYGARLVFISDSCHSGTINRFASALTGSESVGDRPARAVRFLPPGAWEDPNVLAPYRSVARVTTLGVSRTTALLLAGCRDFEYSYDAWWPTTGGDWRANGAFTAVALDVLKGLPEGATYQQWHAAIRTMLPSTDYPQTPMLTGTYDQRNWKVF